jgi:hypothetical protein
MEPDTELQEYLKDVVGAVEANSFEQLCLWRECHQELNESWVENRSGLWRNLGPGTTGRDTCLSLITAVVGGKKVLFWDATSSFVDHTLIDLWLRNNLPRSAGRERDGVWVPSRTNAMNFHNVFRG